MGQSIDKNVEVICFILDEYRYSDFIKGIRDVKNCKCSINYYTLQDSIVLGYKELSKKAKVCDHWDVILNGNMIEVEVYIGNSVFKIDTQFESIVSVVGKKLYITSNDGIVIEIEPLVGDMREVISSSGNVMYS